jgi:hypothetical protein
VEKEPLSLGMTMIVIQMLMLLQRMSENEEREEELCCRAACEQQFLQNFTKSNMTKCDSVKMAQPLT